jgi:uncharacterized protein (DUF2267 family)
VKGEQFIAEVRDLAELDNDEDAQKAIGATLETLTNYLKTLTFGYDRR